MSRAVDGPRVPSGSKYRTPEGGTAVRNGQKSRTAEPAPIERKPEWLRVRIPSGGRYREVREIVQGNRLATVCEESHCPNMGECWNNGTATIMVMGSVCTRACRFCAVDTGNPQGRLDPQEPASVAESVRLMGLRYVVLTSVDRDDLADGGAAHYASCVRAIKTATPEVAVEALTPDFLGRVCDVETVVNSGLEVFAQNVETVERLTHEVRDPRAGYQQTLDVLAYGKRHRPEVLTKTSLILGLGETDDEIRRTMDDLRAHGVDLLTMGQYLRPTPHHLPIARWVSPEDFDRYRAWGLERGFLEVAAGPLVRSSYRADRILDGDNLGLATDAGRIPLRQL
ncbi:MAG: lipoyl synthase [Pseudomonadota bacterium]|nr:lipoyl synthase [Pseudomonadota bacterium]